MNLIINTDQLRAITEALTTHLDEMGLSSTEIPWDYYWNIPIKERYNPYEKPQSPDLGQLFDDWADLEKITRGESLPLGYALVCLSSILLALGEVVQMPRSEDSEKPQNDEER